LRIIETAGEPLHGDILQRYLSVIAQSSGPMTRFSRAASTTSAVTIWSALISSIRAIWLHNRCTSRFGAASYRDPMG